MGLKDIKFVNNTGSLPKYGDGTPGTLPHFEQPPMWQAPLQFDNNDGQTTIMSNYYTDPTVNMLQGGVEITSNRVKPLRNLKGISPDPRDFKLDTSSLTKQQATVPQTKGVDWGKVGKTVGNIGISALNNVGSILGFAGQIANAGSTGVTTAEMIQNAGNSSIDGEQYQRKTVNAADIMARDAQMRQQNTMGIVTSGAATGASIGSVAGPIGTAIGAVGGALLGGIFGSSASRRAKREAERRRRYALTEAANFNEGEYSTAYTNALRKKQAREYGNQNDQFLYAASEGAEQINLDGETVKKHVVDTASGKQYRKQNAWAEKNEWIWDPIKGYLNHIDHGKNDTARIWKGDQDVIFSNRIVNPETGNKIASDVPAYAMAGELPRLVENQIMARNAKDAYMKQQRGGSFYRAKYGFEPRPSKSLPGFKLGLDIPSLVANLPTAIHGIGQILHSGQDTKVPYTYAKADNSAINTLYGLRHNPYPELQLNKEATQNNRYAIDRSGALGAGQRWAAKLSNDLNERFAAANILANSQNINNQYLADAAKTELNFNQQDAARRQNATQFDYEKEAASHNAKIQNREMGWYNLINGIQSYLKNSWEKNQFDKMYGLYATDVANNAAALGIGSRNQKVPGLSQMLEYDRGNYGNDTGLGYGPTSELRAKYEAMKNPISSVPTFNPESLPSISALAEEQNNFLNGIKLKMPVSTRRKTVKRRRK